MRLLTDSFSHGEEEDGIKSNWREYGKVLRT